jgi:hypothetical protein
MTTKELQEIRDIIRGINDSVLDLAEIVGVEL